MPEQPKRRKSDSQERLKVDLTPLDGGTYQMALTGTKVAVIKPLNGFEQLAADDFAGDTVSGARTVRTYGICMLRKLDGAEVAPLSHPNEFENVARTLTSRDTLLLMTAYNQLENPDEGLELKNGLSSAGE